MKTENLIDMLSTNVAQLKRGQIQRVMALAFVIGGAASFCVMLATVGLRSEAAGGFHIGFLALKLLFTLRLMALGTVSLAKLIRPGQNERKLFALIFVPFLVAAFLGALALALEPSASWKQMVLGAQWAPCLYCIPLFAVLPFAALILALRRGAPVNLKRTGAIAGLVAGALGAAVYAFHCSDDSLPFIAVWYGGMIALCAWIGSKLGPWLLRW